MEITSASPEYWSKKLGVILYDYYGWELENVDINAQIEKEKFLKLAENSSCFWAAKGLELIKK